MQTYHIFINKLSFRYKNDVSFIIVYSKNKFVVIRDHKNITFKKTFLKVIIFLQLLKYGTIMNKRKILTNNYEEF